MNKPPSAKQASISWLRTAQDDCALDTEAFGHLEPALDRVIWDVVKGKVDGPPQGLQAAVELLGEGWRRKNLPDHPNNPALLLPPYLARVEREALLREMTGQLVEAIDNLEHQEPDSFGNYAAHVEQAMRSRLVQQLARVERGREDYSMADLQAATAETMGAALAALWEREPSLRKHHLHLLRGHVLPPPLRRHVWEQGLASAQGPQAVAARLARVLNKDGVGGSRDLDHSPLALAVRRTTQELFSSNKALQTHSFSSPATAKLAVQVVVRLVLLSGSGDGGGGGQGDGGGGAASTRSIQRWLLLLAPMLLVFDSNKQPDNDESFAVSSPHALSLPLPLLSLLQTPDANRPCLRLNPRAAPRTCLPACLTRVRTS